MDKLCREDTSAIIIRPSIVIGSLHLSKHSRMLSDFLFLVHTLEIHLSISVCVQYIYHSSYQRILLQLRNSEKLLHRERPILVQVQLLEALAQTTNLFCLNCRGGREDVGSKNEDIQRKFPFRGQRWARLDFCVSAHP